MRALRRARVLLLGCGVVLLTAGCATDDLPSFAMPARGATNQADRILLLWQGAWIAALAVGALVWGLIIWTVIFHRRRKGTTGLPPQIRYNVPIETLYIIAPLLAVGSFFFFTARDESKIEKVSTESAHEITVTGIQWSWQFTYASDGDETTTVTGTPGKPPTLVLPEGELVRFTLHSDDVIHSFWIPAFLYKLDVIPGQTNRFEVVPEKQGTFKGKCAELCGQDHARMLFNVRVVPAQEYDDYVSDLQAEGPQ